MHENKQPQFLIHHANDPRFLHLRSLQLPPRPLSHRPLPDRRHSTRRPDRRRARPDSVVVPLSGSSIKPIRKEAGTKAPPVWHSQRAARSAALSRSYARGGAAGAGRRCPAAMVFYKRRPAAKRLRLARGGIHRLAGEPWHDYPNRRGDRRHWNRRDRRHADPYEPTAIRAGMGSLFLQRLVRCSAREFTDWARAFDVALVGSSPTGLLDYRAFRCRWPAALLIGSEKHGLSDQLAEACDFMVRIPMVGRGDSINAAVAAGILLYELFNRRRALQGGYGESSSVHAG